MLTEKNQLDYNPLHFKALQADFNTAMINLANMQTDLIKDIPEDVQRISRMTESLSNVVIISGNCFFYKFGSNFKVVENSNIFFDKNLNIVKLNPTISYNLEPKQNKNKLSTSQSIRVYDKEKSMLKNIDDLLIKKETINIETQEQRYQYILSLEFQEIQNFNNLYLKLNEETLSYPKIAEIYYVDSKRHKKNLKLFNNNSYSYDIDLNKNINNIYSLDFDIVEADNIHIVFEDLGLDLILDEVQINFTEYNSEGYIIFEALEEELPILKLGIEGKVSDDNITFNVSHDLDNWYPLDLSNTYNIQKVNKVVSWNTLSPSTINTAEDVRRVYLRVNIKATEKEISLNPKINREINSSGSFNTPSDIDSYSVYETADSIHYGEKTLAYRFDFKDLYDKGEYLLINNNYYVKGFIETPISKVNASSYTYAPTTLKTKELRVQGKTLELPNVDISSKVLYSYSLENITKSLLDLSDINCVIPLDKEAVPSVYYVKQEDDLITIDLSCGYINSVLEVLFVVKENKPIYLLDSFKNLVERLTDKIFEITSDEKNNPIYGVSLLDSSLFNSVEFYSRTYPIVPLKNSELGLIDNKLESLNKDTEILITHINKTLLYTKDTISNKNNNYTSILSDEDYERSKLDNISIIPSTTKAFKLKKATVVKGSLKLEEL